MYVRPGHYMYQLLVAGIHEALLDTEDHVCPSWPYMLQLLVAGIHEALLDTQDLYARPGNIGISCWLQVSMRYC